MTRVVRIHHHGGPEALTLEDVEVGAPGPGEVLVRHHAIGLNFIDTYHRSGLYPIELPAVLGSEAAGVVEAVGEGVDDFAPGDRIAYVSLPLGAYAAARRYPAERAFRIPDSVSFETAAATMLKGMTVQYLIERTFPVRAGMTVLWHAAAGGVGLLACSWLRALGVSVIGTVSSDAKAELALAHGGAHAIVYTREHVPTRVREITGGHGVPVVFDSVGRATFVDSLDCLAPLGTMVSFGNSSGPVDPIAPSLLAQKGSLFLTRPTLATYTASRADLVASAERVFDSLREGAITVAPPRRYRLEEAQLAHRELEARATTGSSVLIP